MNLSGHVIAPCGVQMWPSLGMAYESAAQLEHLVLIAPEGGKQNLRYARLCPTFARACARAAARILQFIQPPDSEARQFLADLLFILPETNFDPGCDDPHIGLLNGIE